MRLLNRLINTAKNTQAVIVLPESGDLRVVDAACKSAAYGLARIILIGKQESLSQWESDHLVVIDPRTSPRSDYYSEELFRLRRSKGLTQEAAESLVQNPMYFGALMVRTGDADGMVTGAVTTSADVLRMALQVVGCREGTSVMSSAIILDLSANPQIHADTWLMADCVVNIDPDSTALAEIAVVSSDTMAFLVGEPPQTALLSFSTAGSANHPMVSKVQDAAVLARKARPGFNIDGEMQFDTAVVESVGRIKMPESTVAGKANVLIFPDIQSGNIGYKIAERVGGAQLIGCVIQGLSRPINDLSRGCSVDDIVRSIVLTAVQSVSNLGI